ncbi:MAG: cupin domain-containing protein [Polaromonas sp.]|uniref:cupin domain-containing protein n=1 Tax=Polaromonas sp. TaxID=1869339 RepID=UPI0025F043AF|nr:cupin domain-containing protein [Polaromonas sp.]MBI2728881.1 cupin domain-containing protein [Polaromonas sp.]
MNQQEFEAQLKAEGFTTIAVVERPVGYALGEHHHTFDACALITRGDFTLTVDGVATTYAARQIFRLPAGTPHLESAGPTGASYISGRREKAAS